MSQFGVNVPPGIAIKSVDEALPAAKKMADSNGEVCCCGMVTLAALSAPGTGCCVCLLAMRSLSR